MHTITTNRTIKVFTNPVEADTVAAGINADDEGVEAIVVPQRQPNRWVIEIHDSETGEFVGCL